MSKYKAIDLTVMEDRRKRAVQRAKQRNIIIPTLNEMKHPELISDDIKEKLKASAFGI